MLGAGGQDRVCLLDDEETVSAGMMRATGDWVNIRDAQLHYLGRKDRLIKRHGKRVNLESLQQVRCFYYNPNPGPCMSNTRCMKHKKIKM